MKIPGLDSLVYRTFWGLDRLGYIRTARDLAGVRPETLGGILVAVTTALGDSICFTPALDALRSRFPKGADRRPVSPRLRRAVPTGPPIGRGDPL